MNDSSPTDQLATLNEVAAKALLEATFSFLRQNQVSETLLDDFARRRRTPKEIKRNLLLYNEAVRAYEDIGVIMATWFSDPKFLDATGHPLPLSGTKGPNSIHRLLRVSGAKTKHSLAMDLMRQSPSIKVDGSGNFLALRRVFVLPGFDVPRAALVIGRFLETVQRNAADRNKKTTLLLERSCHVSEVDLSTIAPILRDIKDQGTAFIDCVDGAIEERRLRRPKRTGVGELGVLVFAWTRPNDSPRVAPRDAPPARRRPKAARKPRPKL